ncbi:MAG TPA: LUD domain-containing protein [Chloroflexota bacterium]|nr:LUD domain-containing protein [Chloroflexota bacterium]
MSFLPRAAALFGVAAGGVAAARAVAALTPEERAALAEVIQAGVELGRRGTARLGRRGREQKVLPPGPRDRYRAGPLALESEPPIPPSRRGPHGEPPPEEAAHRFEAASRAFEARFNLALDAEQLRKNLLYYQRTWRWQRDAAVAELGKAVGDGPSQTLGPQTIQTEPRPEEARKETDPGRYGPAPDRERGEDEDFDVLRRRLARIKDDVIANLPAYVAQFRRNAERNGVVVYEARDAADANRYVAELARTHAVRTAVKSKSMVSEEIHLNHALEEVGVRVVETDFGEWIAQLDHDRPAHMISPIAHKNRYEVGDAITRATGVATTGEDIPEMAAIARAQLRKDFIAAEMGISGANALVASTGAIMLVTNEGNGRLVTSLPRVHVAICGAEKLIPDMAAAMLQERVLGRSGTGQSQTVYQTFKSGPDRPGAEMHVVLLDNGRSKMAADPELAAALRCIRCGACANVCPPYGVVGGHTFGYVYAGAIGLVTTPFHHGLENDADAQSLCLQCNACATVCPVAIPLPRQILDVRRRVVDAAGPAPHLRAMLAVWRQPRLFDKLARVGAALAAAFATEHPIHGRLLTRLPLPAQFGWRTPPAPAPRPARDTLRIPEPSREGPLARSGARGLTVAYFVQCLTDRLFPDMAQATVDVIAACGARVVVPPEQHCCGLVCDDAGDRAGAVALAKQTIEALDRTAAHWIVTGASSCAIAMLHDYEHIFAGEPAWQERARRLAGRTLDFTSFLSRVAELPDGALANGDDYAVTYHNFCGSNNVLALHDEPRRIIRDVLGLSLHEMEEAGVCCGFGGSFSVEHPRVSQLVAERKLANADATGAQILVTDNPGCIAHLRGAMHASGRPTRVVHLAELVAQRLREVST